MTRLRVALPANYKTTIDWAHQRHFYEAIALSPEVELVEPTAKGGNPDVDFTTHGQNGFAVWRGDPHSMVVDYDISTIIMPDQEAILTKMGLTFPRDLIAADVRSHNPKSCLTLFRNIPEGTFFAPVMRDPFKEWIGDKCSNLRFFRIPLGCPESIFYADWKTTRFIDVFFLGAVCIYYPMRLWLLKCLNDERGTPASYPRSNIHFVYGEAPGFTGKPAPFWTVDEQDKHQRWYADCLRHAKIFPMCGGIYGCPVSKYFEAMACGCLVIAPLPRDWKILGFRDGVNMVVPTADNFMDKVRYYLAHDDEREAIAMEGWKLARAHHVHGAQVRNMVGRLRRILFDKEPADKVEADNDAVLAS